MKSTRREDHYRLIQFSFGLMILCVFVLIMFFSDAVYARKRVYMPNALLLVCGLFIVYGLTQVTKLNFILFSTPWAVVLISILLLIVQLIFAYNYYFYSDWDVQVVIEASMKIAHGEIPANYNEYFSRYPNNLLMVFIFSRVIALADLISASTSPSVEYMSLIALQCLINCSTGVLLFHIVDKFLGNQYAWIAFFLYVMLVVFSPWVSIPYSDSLGLFLPTGILTAYLLWSKDRSVFWKWMVISGLSVFGYHIKPQIFIVTIAIAVVSSISIAKKHFPFSWEKTGFAWAGILFGALAMSFFLNTAVDNLPFDLNPERRYGVHHFLMMGSNPEAMGVWNQNDVDFSYSFDSVSRRDEENLYIAQERISDLGLKGVLQLWARKTLTNYNDGTFCWAGEGLFFKEVLPQKNNSLSPFLRNLYYSRNIEGDFYPVWSNFEQMLWVTVLFLCIFSATGRVNKNIAVIMLSIIGLTIFETVFEARARYLYVYAPFYILLAMVGIKNIASNQIVQVIINNG